MTKSKGKIVVKIKGHLKGSLLGSAPGATATTVSKWPAKRPGRLPLITQQQQTTWDIVQVDIKSPEPSEFASAIAATAGTAFYTRDILILAEYGHYLSWPGWGPYPQGCLIFPTTLGLTAGGGLKNRPLGLPQKVNGITTLQIDNSSDPVKIDVTTHRPAHPELAIWCCAPNPCLKFKKALGVFLPHGSKLFLPCDPTYYPTTRSTPGAYGWDIPCTDLQCDHCQFAIIERSITAPIVEWTSQLHDCPTCTPIMLDGMGVEIGGNNYAFPGSPTGWLPVGFNTVQSYSGTVGPDGNGLVTSSPGHWAFDIHCHVEATAGALTGSVAAYDWTTNTVWGATPPITATPGAPADTSISIPLSALPAGLSRVQIATQANGPSGTAGLVRTFPGNLTVHRFS